MQLRLFTLAFFLILLSGCSGVARHAEAVDQGSVNRLTVGTVQREIKVGMTGVEVLESLGAPNMVSTDDKRREVWVYEKISSYASRSSESGGVSGSLILFKAAHGRSAGARISGEKTLTVIIKFDKESRVRDFSYRSSSF